MHHRASLHLLAALGAALIAAPAASADTPIASTTIANAITADAGMAAWRAPDGRVVLRLDERAPFTTSLRPPADAILDVGARSGGGAQLAYASGCSTRTHRCTLTTVALTTGRLTPHAVARFPYTGGGAPAVAIEGHRYAYAVHGTTAGTGARRVACDVPYVATIGRTSARKLDRGHCAEIDQLDLGDGRLALLTAPKLRATEARVIKLSGGRSRTVQAESQGEESNYVGAVSIDGGALYTSRGGFRQANVFTRFSFKDNKTTEARAFLALVGPFARDGGRQLYTEQPAGGSFGCQGTAGLPACLVVAGTDPFAGERTLPTELALAPTTQPVFTDTPPSATVIAMQRRVTSSALVTRVPVAGLPVELLSTRLAGEQPDPPMPTGATGTTGADGTATIAIPGPAVPRLSLAAASRPTAAGEVPVQTGDTFLLQTFVHVTATPERLADGRLRITGTISPAQPGRKVKLERRIDHACQTPVAAPPSVTPSSAGTPSGCYDRWSQNPLATAAVSLDGATYAIEAATPADVYRISLDFAGGADVFAGESAQITAP